MAPEKIQDTITAKNYLPKGGEPLTYVAGLPLEQASVGAFFAVLAATTHAQFLGEQLHASEGILGTSPITNPLHTASRALHTTINERVREKTAEVNKHGAHIAVIDPDGIKEPGRVSISYDTLARFEKFGPRPEFTPHLNRMSEAPQQRSIEYKEPSRFEIFRGAVWLAIKEPGQILDWAINKLPKISSARPIGAVALSR